MHEGPRLLGRPAPPVHRAVPSGVLLASALHSLRGSGPGAAQERSFSGAKHGQGCAADLAMHVERRTAETLAKAQRGGLPLPTDDEVHAFAGDGAACDGCGDAISLPEMLVTINVRGILRLCFHDSCYETWASLAK
jgi:hypothetical protein